MYEISSAKVQNHRISLDTSSRGVDRVDASQKVGEYLVSRLTLLTVSPNESKQTLKSYIDN